MTQKYIVWPDYDVCEVDDLPQMSHKSDDYMIVESESEEDAIAVTKQIEGEQLCYS